MTANATARPLIWVLKGLRAGDTAQAMALALRFGGRVEAKQLAFNAWHGLPNWMAGARVSHLTREARTLLRPPWPELVVATGRRTAPVAVWIKQQSQGRTVIVQLGRPRLALRHFDLVVTTPQYGLPPCRNVCELVLPFTPNTTVDEATIQHFRAIWKDLPRPLIFAAIGGSKFPVRLDVEALTAYGAALNEKAHAAKGSVVIVDSPRSDAKAAETVSKAVSAPNWAYWRGQVENPYRAALQLCDELVVTSDSVSMVTDMVMTGKPTSIFRLPVSRLAQRWSARSGPAARLAALGVLHPPRDVDGFMQLLLDRGLIAQLGGGSAAATASWSHEAEKQRVVDQIRSFLAASSAL
jgi:uncharacterized protein